MANLVMGFLCSAATSPNSPEAQLLKTGTSMLGQFCQTAGSMLGGLGSLLSGCSGGHEQCCAPKPGAQQCGSTLSEKMSGHCGNGGCMPGLQGGLSSVLGMLSPLAGLLGAIGQHGPAGGACQPGPAAQCAPAPGSMAMPTPTPTGPGCATPTGTGGALPPAGFGVPMDGSRATRELARHFDQISGGPDCKVSTGQLQQIASSGCMPNGQTATPELRSACQFLLANPDKLAFLDKADAGAQGQMGTGMGDGMIGKGDVNAALMFADPAVGEKATVDTLARHSGTLCANPSGGFTRGDIQQIASTGCLPNGQAAPADLQAAARDLTARPELFDKLDSAYKVLQGKADQRGDGFISRADIAAVQGSHAMRANETQKLL